MKGLSLWGLFLWPRQTHTVCGSTCFALQAGMPLLTLRLPGGSDAPLPFHAVCCEAQKRQGSTKQCGMTHILSPVSVHMGKLQPGDRGPASPEVREPRSRQLRYPEVSPPASLPQVQNDDTGMWAAVSWVIFTFHG